MVFYSLPHDNLYKFVALSGIALLLISIPYPLGKLDELAMQLAELEGQVSVLAVKRNQLKNETTTLNQDPSSFSDAVARLHKAQELEIAAAELDAKLRQVESSVTRINSYKLYFSFGAGIGSVLALFGFFLWYWRIQRHQDKKLHTGNPP